MIWRIGIRGKGVREIMLRKKSTAQAAVQRRALQRNIVQAGAAAMSMGMKKDQGTDTVTYRIMNMITIIMKIMPAARMRSAAAVIIMGKVMMLNAEKR